MGWRLSILLLAAVLSASCAARVGVAPIAGLDGVRFSIEKPAAHAVAVAGTFNGWSPTSHPMARAARGRWTLVVPLPPGEHLFMYVVDGLWVTPPEAADFVDDGFGGRNGVVVVLPER